MIETINTSMLRRKFLKLTAATIAAMNVGIGVYSPSARASVASIASLLYIDAATLEYKIFSPCCNYCPDYFVVSHYQPTVLCEVIKGGGDSVVGGSMGSPLMSAGVDSNDYTAMHVRLWKIPDWQVNMAMMGQGCKMCGVDAATSSAGIAMTTSACGGAVDAIQSTVTNKINEQLPDCFPKLLYTTETDPTWNTGCRDWASTAVTDIECSAIGSMVTSMFGLERCIGSKWGPLYPRQMAVKRDDPRVVAGILAYRALHIARKAIGSLPFDTAMTIGKLQQTTPHKTTGYNPGSAQLHSGVTSGSVARDHVYTFVWWLPVVCCKEYSEIFGFCTPEMPC